MRSPNGAGVLRIGAALIVIALAYACSSKGAAVQLEEIRGTDWVAEEIDGDGVVSQAHSTLRFDADRVSGDTACNKFAGTWKRDGNDVRLGPLASTRRACPPPIMEQEQRFTRALDATRQMRLSGSKLELIDESGHVVAVFKRLPM